MWGGYSPTERRAIMATLPARGEQFWDGRMTHNPVVRKIGSKYVLYYTGTTYAGPYNASIYGTTDFKIGRTTEGNKGGQHGKTGEVSTNSAAAAAADSPLDLKKSRGRGRHDDDVSLLDGAEEASCRPPLLVAFRVFTSSKTSVR